MTEEDCTGQGHCTAALPGQIFQEIYVCRLCCFDDANQTKASSSSSSSCLCQACAETCHAHCVLIPAEKDKDEVENGEEYAVEYVGVGPASCDCRYLGSSCHCQLYESSCALVQQQFKDISDWDASCTLPCDGINHPVRVYDIPTLQKESVTRMIIDQAQLLVQYSKDTFWIDCALEQDETALCSLEQVALAIFKAHVQNDGIAYRGAEWWVQVKEQPPRDGVGASDKAKKSDKTAIDLHYDKDEVLAETFGIGVFPTFSTVTYLTPSRATPTLIFPRTYHDVDTCELPHVHVSRPLQGKHLVFDGSLLHGAIPLPEGFIHELDAGNEATMQPHRVTFLVNLWKSHCPMGIQYLPNPIRQQLLRVSGSQNSLSPSTTTLEARLTAIPSVPCQSMEWIELPFVKDGMVARTVSFMGCIRDEHDVVRVEFKKGLEAYLYYPGDEHEEAEDDDTDGDEQASNPSNML